MIVSLAQRRIVHSHSAPRRSPPPISIMRLARFVVYCFIQEKSLSESSALMNCDVDPKRWGILQVGMCVAQTLVRHEDVLDQAVELVQG